MASLSVAKKSWANGSDDPSLKAIKVIEIRVYSPQPLRIPCGDWAKFLSAIDDVRYLHDTGMHWVS